MMTRSPFAPSRQPHVYALAPALLLALGAAGCCMSGSSSAPSPAPTPVVATPPPPAAGAAPFSVAPGVPTWSSTYEAVNLSDNDPATAWYTPASHPLPVVLTLTLTAPAQLVGVDFDTNLGSYATSAARDITVDVLGPDGQVATTASGGLNQAAITSMPLPMPVMATSVRITIRTNHGGSYTGLAGIALRTTPGTGQAPMAAVDRGLAYSVSGLPQWNDTYALGMMSDGNPGTQWYTPMSPTFPLSGVAQLTGPGVITGFVFDTHLGSYATSAVRELTLELLGPAGQVSATIPVTLAQDATTPIQLPAPTPASQVRITVRSNHGGPYAGLAEFAILGTGTRF